jgi:hypothetical protein
MAMRYWTLVRIPGGDTLLNVPIEWLFLLLYGCFIWREYARGLKRWVKRNASLCALEARLRMSDVFGRLGIDRNPRRGFAGGGDGQPPEDEHG